MNYSLEESHEAGHALLAYMAGGDVITAMADSCHGYTRLKPLPADTDGDRLIIAQSLHIAAGLAGQRMAGFGKADEWRCESDKDELKAWHEAQRQARIMECFTSAEQFWTFMACTAEEILRQHEDAFTEICSKLRGFGSISQIDLDVLPAHTKWIAPGHDQWWDAFLRWLRGSSEALMWQDKLAAATRAQQAQSEVYRRRYEELRSRSAEPERTTFHRPRVESML